MINVAFVQSVNRYLVISVGSILLVLALIGNGIIIFLFGCRKGKFRKSPCSFYFTFMSVIKTIHLVHVLVFLIISIGFGIDPTISSVVYCKVRYSVSHAVLPQISLTLECAASISQYLASSRHVSYRQKNNHKMARICSSLIVCFWSLQSIPFLVLYKIQIDKVTHKPLCDSFNTILTHYAVWMLRIVSIFVLLCVILPIFGCLTLRNIRRLGFNSSQQQRIERQMSAMLLVQSVSYMIGCIPFSAWGIYVLFTATYTKSLERKAIEGLVTTIMYLLVNSTLADSFYLFYATSKPFRKQCRAAFQAVLGHSQPAEQMRTSLATAIVEQTDIHRK